MLQPLESSASTAVRIQYWALLAVAIAIVLSAAAVFVPCAISLILASWVATFARPWMTRLTEKLGGRSKAAALVTTLLVLAVLIPLLGILIPMVLSAVQLASSVSKSGQWQEAAKNIVGDGSPINLVKVLREHAASAAGTTLTVLQSSAAALFGIAMFIVSFYALLRDGEAIHRWLRNASPIRKAHFDRLAAAYVETGRGLVVGVGSTALVQGVLATITYAAVGIPRALPLGLLTTVSALIPGFGTVILWAPIAGILALGGFPVKGAIVALSGVFVIGSVDNFLKPVLANRAHLDLPPILLFIAMLSGLAAFGPAGLLLGPLFVRMAVEVVRILQEDRLV